MARSHYIADMAMSHLTGERRMDSKNYPSRLADKFVLRLDAGMRDELKVIAAQNRRSMNSEIISRLAASLEAEKEKAPNA